MREFWVGYVRADERCNEQHPENGGGVVYSRPTIRARTGSWNARYAE